MYKLAFDIIGFGLNPYKMHDVVYVIIIIICMYTSQFSVERKKNVEN